MSTDVQKLKKELSMEALLDYYEIKLRRERGSLVGCCPIHHGDNPNAFHVSPQKGLWHCFTKCCRGGDVLAFIKEYEQVNFPEALEIAQNLMENPACQKSRSPPMQREPERKNLPLKFRLSLDPSHPYLKERGLEAETIKHFGLGFCSQGILKGRIAIPIEDEQGQLVAYAGRSLNGKRPKYQFPRGFLKSQVLFNYHRVSSTGSASLILVEGFFDVFKVHQAGFPNVVALMGSSLSKAQAELLLDLGRKLIVLLDGDRAGREGTRKIIQALRGGLPLIPKYLPRGVQPDLLDKETLSQILGRR